MAVLASSRGKAPSAAMMRVPLLALVHYCRFLHRPVARWLRGLRRPRNDLLTSLLNAASMDPDNAASILHGVLVGPVVPLRAQREAIEVPTLIIGHGGDLLHELSDAKALAHEIPNVRLLRARSVAELRTRPQRLWPEISDYLRTVAAAAPSLTYFD